MACSEMFILRLIYNNKNKIIRIKYIKIKLKDKILDKIYQE